MALEFPNSPNLNETYPYQGVMYVWDGVKWTSKGTTSGLPIYPDVDGNVVITGTLEVQGTSLTAQSAYITNNLTAVNGDFSGDLSVAGDIIDD